MQSQQPHNADQTRLDEIFKALRERKDLLADDEIRNIVGKEHSASTQGVAGHQAGRALFFQRYFTRKVMIVSSIIISAMLLIVALLNQQPTSREHQASANISKQFTQENKSKPTNLSRQIEYASKAIRSKQMLTQNSVSTPRVDNLPNSTVEGLRILELNDIELARLGIVVDSLGGIFQARKRAATGLETFAASLLPSSRALIKKDTTLRLDMIAVLPKLAEPLWVAAALGKPYQRFKQLADSIFQAEMRDPDLQFFRNVPRNQWNEERLNSIRKQHKANTQAMDVALAKFVEADVLYEEYILEQNRFLLQPLLQSTVPVFEVIFVRTTTGKEWFSRKGKSGEAMPSFTFTDESKADSLQLRIENARTKEESDSAEKQLRRLYIENPAKQRQLRDSAFAAQRARKLQQIKDSIPTRRLLGVKVQREEHYLILWCSITSTLVQALPDRYRIPLERELAAAQKYSSLCEIPTREEREEVEQIIAGKPFLETWRSCSGALSVKSLSPNPAQNDVTTRFVLTAPRTVTAALHDIRGLHLETLQSGQNFQAGEHHLFLNLARHSAGMYLLVLTTTQGEQTVQRVLIEK
mgnify:FL=1